MHSKFGVEASTNTIFLMLKGRRKGQYSIRINGQWRVCFRWSGGHALDVEIVDYHD